MTHIGRRRGLRTTTALNVDDDDDARRRRRHDDDDEVDACARPRGRTLCGAPPDNPGAAALAEAPTGVDTDGVSVAWANGDGGAAEEGGEGGEDDGGAAAASVASGLSWPHGSHEARRS